MIVILSEANNPRFLKPSHNTTLRHKHPPPAAVILNGARSAQ